MTNVKRTTSKIVKMYDPIKY